MGDFWATGAAAQNLHQCPLLLRGSEACWAFRVEIQELGLPQGRVPHRNSKAKGFEVLPQSNVNVKVIYSIQTFLSSEGEAENKNPARRRGTHSRRDWILFHFRGRCFDRKSRLEEKCPSEMGWGGEEMTGRLENRGSERWRPMEPYHPFSLHGRLCGLWTAPTGLPLNNSRYTTFSREFISDPTI